MRGDIAIRGATGVLDGWIPIRRYRVENTAGGALHTREVVHRPDLAAVLPHSQQRQTITLVSQARLAVRLSGGDDDFLEAPSGRIDPGETPVAAAVRELREETGWSATQLDAAGCVFLHPALTMERAHLFLCATDGIATPPGAPDGHDVLGVLRVVELRLDRAVAMCRSGAISDAKTALLIALLADRHNGFCNRSDA